MSEKSKELREKLTSFSVSIIDKIMHLMTSKVKTKNERNNASIYERIDWFESKR